MVNNSEAVVVVDLHMCGKVPVSRQQISQRRKTDDILPISRRHKPPTCLFSPQDTPALFFGLPVPVPPLPGHQISQPYPLSSKIKMPPQCIPSLTPPSPPPPPPPPDSDSDSSRSCPPSRRLPYPPSPPLHASPPAAASQTQSPPAPSDRAASRHWHRQSRRAPPRAWRIQSRRIPTPPTSAPTHPTTTGEGDKP